MLCAGWGGRNGFLVGRHRRCLMQKTGRIAGAWCLVLGAWCLVLGAWCLVLGAWCLVLGAWCLVESH